MSLMLRVLSGMAAMIIFAGIVAPPAVADPLGSTINFRISDTLPDITDKEIVTIQRGLIATVDFNRKKSAWACVARPTVSSDEIGDVRGKGAEAEVVIIVRFGRRPNGDAFVLEAISVGGTESAKQTDDIPKTLLEGDRGVALRDQAVKTLEQLMSKVTPCKPKVKVKAKTQLRGDLQWTGGWDGEAQLALGGTGDFAGTLPVTYSWTPMVIPGGVCTVAIANSRSLMDYAGHFEEGDKNLKFTRMQLHGLEGPATASCTVEGQTTTRTMSLPLFAPMEAAAEYDIRIPLQQSARVNIVLRPPAPGAFSDFTMDLTFEDEGTPVAVVMPVVVRSDDAR